MARTSLPQMPVASIFTNTSPSPTGGMGTSRISTVNAFMRTQDLFVVMVMGIVSWGCIRMSTGGGGLRLLALTPSLLSHVKRRGQAADKGRLPSVPSADRFRRH